MIHHSEGFGKRTSCGKSSNNKLSSYNWNLVDCPKCLASGEIGPTTWQVFGSLGLLGVTIAPIVWLIVRYAFSH